VAVLEFRVLGPLEVRRDGEPVAISAPKQRALLGLLLLHAGEPVAQDMLIEQLWGEDAPPTARAALQNYVHALRTLLGPEVLERQPAGYVVHVDPERLDLSRFEHLVAEARRAEPRERAAKLRQALSCWRGPALVEFPDEPFAQHEIGRLEEERLTALEDRIDAELELGRHSDLVVELEAEISRYPLRERLWAQLMLALYRAGRQTDALDAYRRAHETFVEALGVEPAVALRDLRRAILLQDPALDEGEYGIGSMLARAAAILPKPPLERAESLYEYGAALLRTGERRRAVSTFAAAERLAAAVGARGLEERARLYGSYLSIWTDGKSPLRHLADAERAAVRFEELGDAEGLWLALSQQGQMLHLSGRPDAALEIAERCVELAASSEDPWRKAGVRRWIAVALADGTARVPDAIARCEFELAAASQDVMSPFGVWSALIVLYAEAGRIDDSRALGESAAAEARSAGLFWFLLDLMERQAAAEVAVGNPVEAIAHLRASYAILEAENDRTGGLIQAAELSRLLALTGEIDEARRLAVSARATASPDLFATEVLWRRALALVAAADGRTDEALHLSDEARARTAASDRLTLHAQTLEETATIRLGAGNPAGAADSLREALATYERKGSIVGAERVRRRIERTV
jgi:DNA-binding SARP family transcriptional activator